MLVPVVMVAVVKLVMVMLVVVMQKFGLSLCAG